MIKWNCNFQIPDSVAQASIALVKVVEFSAIGLQTKILIEITNEEGDNILKQYEMILNKSYSSVDAIYADLVKEFDNAEIV